MTQTMAPPSSVDDQIAVPKRPPRAVLFVAVIIATMGVGMLLGRVTAPSTPPPENATVWTRGFHIAATVATGQQNGKGESFSQYARSVVQPGDCSNVMPGALAPGAGNYFWDGEAYRVPITVPDCDLNWVTVAEVRVPDGTVHPPSTANEGPTRDLWTEFKSR